MTYEVRTPVFEGPLDLLLQLITSHHLEVTELSLGDLVTEYLAHLEVMRTFDLEVTSEFLVIASTLVQLKSRSLLPGDSDIDLDEDLLLAEERDRLLSRLLANLTFKDVAAVLAHRMAGTETLHPRTVGLDPDIDVPRPPVRVGADAMGLMAIAARVFSPRMTQPTLDHLDLDLPSVSEAMRTIQSRIESDLRVDFEALTSDLKRSAEVIAYFLAILELSRWGMLSAHQEDPDAPIVIEHREATGDQVIESEFDAFVESPHA